MRSLRAWREKVLLATVLRKLGKDLVTVALPFSLFQEMEANVARSFLEKEPWTDLAAPHD